MSVVVAFPGAEESRRTSFVGMVMALASWTMLFVALFFSYAVLRLNAVTWPPDGLAPLPKALPFLNTLVLLASSAVLHRGTRPESERTPGALRHALLDALTQAPVAGPRRLGQGQRREQTQVQNSE